MTTRLDQLRRSRWAWWHPYSLVRSIPLFMSKSIGLRFSRVRQRDALHPQPGDLRGAERPRLGGQSLPVVLPVHPPPCDLVLRPHPPPRPSPGHDYLHVPDLESTIGHIDGDEIKSAIKACIEEHICSAACAHGRWTTDTLGSPGVHAGRPSFEHRGLLAISVSTGLPTFHSVSYGEPRCPNGLLGTGSRTGAFSGD
jgi:hypothetical protein